MRTNVQIKEIADIRTGYTFRKPVVPSRGAGLLGLQIGDIRDVTRVDPDRLSAVEWHGKGPPPVLVPGDVVLAAKGSHNYGAMFDHPSADILPSNQLLVLSVKNPTSLSPEFLCWALNYSETQQRIAELRRGTSIPSISKGALAIVPIPLPNKAVQDKILKLQALADEQHKLLEALQRNSEAMLQGMVEKLLKGAGK